MEEINLYHYSGDLFTFKRDFDLPKKELHRLELSTAATQKPMGFWVSCENLKDDWTWKDWCEEQEFNLEDLKYKYRVVLSNNSNVLHISTPEEFDKFENDFLVNLYETIDDPYMEKFCQMNPWKVYLKTYFNQGIDWKKVCQRYQGVLIAPYRGDKRAESMWYMGWDCSSGCIWDFDCIEECYLTNPQ